MISSLPESNNGAFHRGRESVEVAASSDPTPLVVDVDGTLLRTDLSIESLLSFIHQAPSRLLTLVLWLSGGRAALKKRIAESLSLPPENLPFNKEVLDFARAEKKAGRPIYLASASDYRYVQTLADHLGFVDGVFASDGDVNLAGASKARRLAERFGPRGFDYIGNERRDLPVWQESRSAILVDAPKGVERQVRNRHPNPNILSSTDRTWKTYLQALRPLQWSKNLLVVVPLIADHRFAIADLGLALTAFIAFSFCTSSIYVLNDLFDLASDRNHPVKSHRPLASGAIPLLHGLAAVPILAGIGLALGSAIGFQFTLILVAYLVIAMAYSISLRKIMLLDVLALASLYTIRLLAGSIAIDVRVLAPWLLGFSVFFFLALAIVKRNTEIIRRSGVNSGALPGRGYSAKDLDVLTSIGTASGFSAVVVLALYINSERVQSLYQTPELLWLVCPLIIYWIGRVFMLGHRGEVDDDPVVFAITDRASLVTGLLVAVVVFAAI